MFKKAQLTYTFIHFSFRVNRLMKVNEWHGLLRVIKYRKITCKTNEVSEPFKKPQSCFLCGKKKTRRTYVFVQFSLEATKFITYTTSWQMTWPSILDVQIREGRLHLQEFASSNIFFVDLELDINGWEEEEEISITRDQIHTSFVFLFSKP